MRNTFLIIVSCLIVTLALFFSSCGGKKVQQSPAAEMAPLSCVVVLPVQVYESDSKNAQMLGNLQAGAEYLDTTIKSELEKSNVSKIIESSQLQPAVSGVLGGKLGGVKEIGSKAQCDFVLVTSLSTFRQRRGGPYAVDLPASVAFEMQLIEASTGKGLWGTSFSETQTTLMSNLFSLGKVISRGFRWVTVEELAEQGMHEKISECPYFHSNR